MFGEMMMRVPSGISAVPRARLIDVSDVHRFQVEPATSEPDPVIEAYKKDVDRTLLRANLARTIQERLQNLARLQRFGEELRRAGRTLC